MSIDTLEDLYIKQLKDLYSANTQALEVTRDLAKSATDGDLVRALNAGADGIRQGVEAIASLAKRHEETPNGEHCKGMEGLVEEARAHSLRETFGEDATRDAMIIVQYQRLVHYAIAGYGSLVAFARRLELDDDADALRQCLDASYDGDRTMTALATGGVNESAM